AVACVAVAYADAHAAGARIARPGARQRLHRPVDTDHLVDRLLPGSHAPVPGRGRSATGVSRWAAKRVRTVSSIGQGRPVCGSISTITASARTTGPVPAAGSSR